MFAQNGRGRVSSPAMENVKQIKIEFFIPETYIEGIRDELANIDIGHIGNYDHCLSFSQVQGYWRPLPGALPHHGEINEISKGTECKVEINVPIEKTAVAVQIIRKNHPYDEPLINLIPLLNQQFGATQ